MNEDLSDFVKFAYKYGKVRDIEETFEAYPVEEEWHKGKIENFCMLISSQLEKLKYSSNKLIKKDEKNRLKKDSLVKTDVIYKISNNQILFKIGSVEKEKIEEYKDCFYKNIKE